MFGFFKRKAMTVREAGALGAAVKRERDRERYKRFHDDMRARLGLPKVEWKE